MDDRQAGRYWEGNAEAWTALARKGFDVYRDLLNTPAFFDLLPDVNGLRGLDVGCGEGYNTRQLAGRGARMTAIDVAPTFIRHAAAADGGGARIDYSVASGQKLPFAAGSFDFVTAIMSLMDMPSPEQALGEVARVLKSGGFLQFSILHPCFSTPHRRLLRDSAGREYALEVGRYFEGPTGEIDEWIFSAAPAPFRDAYPPFRIPRFHRPVSEWINLIVAAGFAIERAEEPYASEELAARHRVIRDTRLVAYFLHMRCRKGAATSGL